MPAKVTVIIAHRNDPHLMETVHQIRTQDPGFDFDVIIVDDNSDPSFRPDPYWMEGNGVKVIQLEDQGGCGRARNHGVMACESPIIAFLDSDLNPDPNWLQGGTKRVSPGIMVTGPVPKRYRNDKPTLAERYNTLESPINSGSHIYGTGNIMMTRNDFIETGMFNESLVRGHDMDFMNRWKGEIAIINDMAVTHPAKTHKEKIQTIKEIVKDWKRLGHKPNFAKRIVPDRGLMRSIWRSDVPLSDKIHFTAYHLYLKGVYVWFYSRH